MKTKLDIIIENQFFGLAISIIAFQIGMLIYGRFRLPVLNPLLIAAGLIIGFLILFDIDVEKYNEGANIIHIFLGPATVLLAVPLYKQIDKVRQNALPILLGITIGSLSSIVSVALISKFLNLNELLLRSLVAKSVTTPIGIEVTNSLGGLPPVTVLSIIITGITGAAIGPALCKLLGIKNKIAVGVALGTASHGVGTSKALELGETEGAMSSLSIGLAGLITVFLMPIVFPFVLKIIN